MVDIKIPLVRATIEEDDIKSTILAVSEKEFSYGKLAQRFEEDFARYIGLEGGVATNSGTSALHLALRALNVKKGDEVILPSYTCISLLQAIHYVQATPVFADIDFDVGRMEYNMDAEDVARRTTKRTKTIIVPHLFGSPARIDKIIDSGIPVIEDATQAIGSDYKDRKVGSFGTISIVSFHESKVLACGEGGMILTNTKDLLDRIRYLADYAYEQPLLRFEKSTTYPFEERYNYKMSGVNAALGISQLKKIEQFVKRRKELAKLYNDELLSIERIDLPDPSYKPNIFFRYMVYLKEKNPTDVLGFLLRHGIEGGRGVYPPLHYYYQSGKMEKYPMTEHAMNHLVSVPLYPSLTETEVEFLINCFKDALKEGL